jgi:hypothetical protein
MDDVFDSSQWEKDASMWKAIKSSYWDDVILDPTTKQSLIDDVQGFFNSRATYASIRHLGNAVLSSTVRPAMGRL